MPAATATAREVPPLQGRINDLAGMLSPSAAHALEAALAELERTDATQIVVLTIPSLEGDSLEDFSLRVAETWRIGQKEHDNGALLLVAKKERKIRIEVGYGLEGTLTDLVSGRIIRNVITPEFRNGNFDRGILAGVSAMVGTVRGTYTAEEGARSPAKRRTSGGGAGLFGLFAALLILNMLGRISKPLGAVAGGVIVPILGVALLGLGLIGFLVLIPVGLLTGLFLGPLGGVLNSSHSRYRSSGSGFWMGGGGFGGGGFGGFSGGGGGFGGGGASGGW